MDEQSLTALQASYDRVADEYARRISDELLHKPLDRELLDGFAAEVGGRGTICDMGCGPGHLARYLHDRGAPVVGIDLSAGMVAEARRRHPQIDFQQGNMLCLSAIADGAWAGIAAFYSIIHVPRREVGTALAELRRTLRPGGLLLLAFHVGDEVVHLDEWWGQPVSADFAFFQSAEMVGYLTAAGFEIAESVERPPYPDVEHQSDRAYILARRPAQRADGGREPVGCQEAQRCRR